MPAVKKRKKAKKPSKKQQARELELLQAAELRDQVMARYRRDPEAWMVERFGLPRTSLRWDAWGGYEAHTWDGTPNPFLAMFEALVLGEWVAVESATSTGKTYMLAPLVYWFLDCFPNSLVVSTAPKQGQLKTILWAEVGKQFARFKQLRPAAELFSLRLLPGGRRISGGASSEDVDAWQALGVVAGVGASEESATKMQGFHRENMLFVVEEAAGVANPIFTAIKNTCTGANNLVVAVGNPDAVTDSLHQFALLPNVRHIIISAYDHPNVVTGRALIPGAVTPASIERRALEYGKASQFYKSRVRGIAPEQGADSLIRAEWLRAVAPTLAENAGKPEVQVLLVECPVDDYSRPALGVDVANSENGDAAALCWGTGYQLTEVQEFTCPNANDIAYNVVYDDLWLADNDHEVYGTQKLVNYGVRADAVGVDVVGVGVGPFNAFRVLGYEVVGLQGGQWDSDIPLDAEEKPLYKFANLRSQMYYAFRQDLQAGEIVFAVEDQRLLQRLFGELVIIKFAITGGSIAVESKKSIKKRLGKSPNLADAAVYWNWMRKDRSGRGLGLMFAA